MGITGQMDDIIRLNFFIYLQVDIMLELPIIPVAPVTIMDLS